MLLLHSYLAVSILHVQRPQQTSRRVVLGLTVEEELVSINVDSLGEPLAVVHRGQSGTQLTVTSGNTSRSNV